MSERKGRSDGTFRLLLILGAIVTIALGVWGLVWTDMLHNIIGFKIPKNALGITHVFGGVMLAVGVGYALAAAQPHRSRSLLVPLFLAPLITAFTVIAGVARDEIRTGQGIVFAIYNLVYCLFYFRLYPRVVASDGPPPAVETRTEPGSPRT